MGSGRSRIINHFWSLAVEEHFYFFWPLVVFLLARRPRALIAVSLTVSLCAMLARVTGSLMGLSWWTTGTLTPFRLDGLALGAFLAVTARQPGGLERLARALPRVAAVVGGLLVVTVVWTHLVSRQGVEMVGATRPALILMLLACLLMWGLIAPERSAISRFFRSRSMVFLGTYSYGLYVYHHFISYYLSTNRTELELARWLGSHGAAVALQADPGRVGLVGGGLRQLRALREAVPPFEAAVRQGRETGASKPTWAQRRRTLWSAPGAADRGGEGPTQRLPQPVVLKRSGPVLPAQVTGNLRL